MFCKKCGSKLDPSSEFCSNCGTRADRPNQNTGPQSQQQFQSQPPRSGGGGSGWQIAAIALAAIVVISGVGIGAYMLTKDNFRNRTADTVQSDDGDRTSRNSSDGETESSESAALEEENKKLQEEVEQKVQEAEEQALIDENARLKARLDVLTQNIESQNSGSSRQTGGTYFGNSYYLSWSDLDGLSRDDIVLLRNEIYARNGYIFKDQSFRNYFSSMSWYSPNSGFHEGMFNSVEKANVDLIVEYEQYMGWR